MFTKFLDVTRRIHSGMEVWPGDPAVNVERVESATADEPAVSKIAMGTHTGTHIDFPSHLHMRLEGPTLDRLIGECHVFESATVRQMLFDGAALPARMLVKGPLLSPSDIEVLVRNNIKLIGVELSSIDEEGSLLSHRLLLGSGIAVIEGLQLDQAPEGPAFLIALPLSLDASDGAPVRAVLAY